MRAAALRRPTRRRCDGGPWCLPAGERTSRLTWMIAPSLFPPPHRYPALRRTRSPGRAAGARIPRRVRAVAPLFAASVRAGRRRCPGRAPPLSGRVRRLRPGGTGRQPTTATGASHASRSTVTVAPPYDSFWFTRYWWPRRCPVNRPEENGKPVVVVALPSYLAYHSASGMSAVVLFAWATTAALEEVKP